MTSHKDLVIWGLDVIRDVLDSNQPVSFSFSGFLGHNLRSIYLNRDLEARDVIVNNVHTILDDFPECQSCAFEVAVNDAGGYWVHGGINLSVDVID